MNKKILLVKLEDLENYQIYPPFGLMYLASSLKLHGYDFEIFHKRATKENMTLLLKKSKESFLVAFSCMTAPSLLHNLDFSKKIKKLGIPVVWGGIHTTMLPEVTIKEDFIDYIIVGEGEETFIKLINALESKKEPKNIPGLGYKKNNKIIINPMPEPIKDLDKYQLTWEGLNIEDYIQPRFGNFKRVLPILTSRGCPHACNFCYNQSVNKRRWRAHSAEYIIKEINKIKKEYNLDAVFFGDDNFFTNKQRALEIIKGIGLPWMADIRADYINEDFVKQIKELKCYGLYVGAESGSDRVLKEIINKGITTEKVETSIKICHKYKIEVETSFVIAFPTETKKEINKTMEFMYYLFKKYDNVFFWAPKIYTPYPGTPLFYTSIQHGLKPPKTCYEWATNLKIYRCHLPWIKEKNKRMLSLLYLMVGLAQMKKNIITWPIRKLEEWRWRNMNLKFPIELELAAFLSKNSTLISLFFKYFKK